VKRVGLVLGAGGSLGWVYHLGVLEALRWELGAELADIDRVVGTSAGAAIAASVLAGAGSDQVLAAVTTPPTGEEMAVMRAAMAEFRSPRRWLRTTAPSMITRFGTDPGLGLGAIAGLMPTGVFPTASLRKFPVGHPDDPWPGNLWIPSVQVDEGRLVVFGRDLIVPVIDAVEATAAVPLMFQPKTIAGRRYLDGAVHSATNADLLLADGRFDLVVVASPMTRPGLSPIKTRARAQLRRETRALERTGAEVVILEPSPEVVELAAGFPRSKRDAGPAIIATVAAEGARVLANRLLPVP